MCCSPLLLSNCLNPDDFKQVVSIVNSSDRFLVTAHVRADGDAVAALCAMADILKKIGKQVYPVLHDAHPDTRYQFLDGSERIQNVAQSPLPFAAEVAIVLDSPSLDRIGDVAGYVRNCPSVICIDHHPGNDGFAQCNLVDTSASSTCEILVNLTHFLTVPLTPLLAESLYAGIAFDTGNFRFSNTTPSALRTAAFLLEHGVKPETISNRLFHQTSLLRIRAMAQTLQSIELHLKQSVAVSFLPVAFFQSHSGAESELEGFSDLAIGLETVRIAVFIREFEPGKFKISLRAKEEWDVGTAAEILGGGGHRKAAGCRMSGEYTHILQQLLETLQRVNPRLCRDEL